MELEPPFPALMISFCVFVMHVMMSFFNLWVMEFSIHFAVQQSLGMFGTVLSAPGTE